MRGIVSGNKDCHASKAVDFLVPHIFVGELVVVKDVVDVSRVSHVNEETVYAELGGKTMGFESVSEDTLPSDLPFKRERNEKVVGLFRNCTVHRTSNED